MICRAGKEHYAFLMTLLSSWMNYFLRCLIPFFEKLCLFLAGSGGPNIPVGFDSAMWPFVSGQLVRARKSPTAVLPVARERLLSSVPPALFQGNIFNQNMSSKVTLINAYLICALRWLVLAYILPHVGNWQGKILSSSLMWVLGGEFFLNDEKSGYFHIAANFILSSYLGIPVPWAK